MRLTIINGSPRGEASNTGALFSHFIRGFEETEGNTTEVLYIIKNLKTMDVLVNAFRRAEAVFLGFPLYVDAMPGSVKEFLEALEPLARREGNPSMGFLIQNGFPETYHNRFAARYMEKFAKRMGCRCFGSILKGGCEGLDIQPAFLTEKYFTYLYEIGKAFGESGVLDGTLLGKLARPEHLTSENIAQVVPFVNKALWDTQLEANGALDKSFDRPYLP